MKARREFPIGNQGGEQEYEEYLRAYYAGQALSVLAGRYVNEAPRMAVRLAEALINELRKPAPSPTPPQTQLPDDLKSDKPDVPF